jgi:hypothetical protein
VPIGSRARYMQKVAMARRCERDYAEKKPYQWFTLLICVARSAYLSKAAQNSAAVSNSRSSASKTGHGRCSKPVSKVNVLSDAGYRADRHRASGASPKTAARGVRNEESIGAYMDDLIGCPG